MFNASLTDWCWAAAWGLSLLSWLRIACFAFRIVSGNEGSGIGAKLGIKDNTKAVDILGGKNMECSRGKGVMFSA